MNKHLLIKNLTENHQAFIASIHELSPEDFTVGKNEKWSGGQQLEHIYLSVKPVSLAFLFPTFLMNLMWGKSNRAGRSYDALIQRYHDKLASGARATGAFIPKKVDLAKGQKLTSKLTKQVAQLCLSIEKFSEDDLDLYILPHPLLGKLTLREMLFFTIYHVKHHENQLMKSGV
jgi:hypothetical protein